MSTNSGENPLVLLVEDDTFAAMIMRSILEREGFQVVHAADGQKALEALGLDEAIALIVLDYQLPDMTGVDIAIELSRKDTAPPSVMVTGYDDPELEARVRALGVFDYILKDRDLTFLEKLATVARGMLRVRPAGLDASADGLSTAYS